jgi:hypothetical protein
VVRFHLSRLSECGAAWLARMLWVHEAPGSNPATPTTGRWLRRISTPLKSGSRQDRYLRDPRGIRPTAGPQPSTLIMRVRPPCAAPRAVNSIGLENRALTPDDLGSSPRRRTKARVAELADAPASSTGALRACGFNSRLAHSIPGGLRKLDATAVRQWGMV